MFLLNLPDNKNMNIPEVKLHRINAIVLHHIYFWKRSVPRWLDIFYWPILTVFIWGFITKFLQGSEISSPRLLGSMLLGGVAFWMIFQRAQQDLSISYLQDIWSRSIVNLYVSPLGNLEFIIASVIIGFIKVVITLVVMALLSLALYGFNLFDLGLSLIPFVGMLLLFAWSLGLFSTGIIFRFGTDAQIIAFSISFILQPFVAVFYPLEILPQFAKSIALAIPITYVFEGMIEVISEGVFNWQSFFWSLGLNCAYLFVCAWFFGSMFFKVKKSGLLAKLE